MHPIAVMPDDMAMVIVDIGFIDIVDENAVRRAVNRIPAPVGNADCRSVGDFDARFRSPFDMPVVADRHRAVGFDSNTLRRPDDAASAAIVDMHVACAEYGNTLAIDIGITAPRDLSVVFDRYPSGRDACAVADVDAFTTAGGLPVAACDFTVVLQEQALSTRNHDSVVTVLASDRSMPMDRDVEDSRRMPFKTKRITLGIVGNDTAVDINRVCFAVARGATQHRQAITKRAAIDAGIHGDRRAPGHVDDPVVVFAINLETGVIVGAVPRDLCRIVRRPRADIDGEI